MCGAIPAHFSSRVRPGLRQCNQISSKIGKDMQRTGRHGLPAPAPLFPSRQGPAVRAASCFPLVFRSGLGKAVLLLPKTEKIATPALHALNIEHPEVFIICLFGAGFGSVCGPARWRWSWPPISWICRSGKSWSAKYPSAAAWRKISGWSRKPWGAAWT